MKRLIFEPEHEQFRDSVVKFMSANVGAHAERFREQGMVDRDLYLKAGEQGLLCTWAEERYGVRNRRFSFRADYHRGEYAPRRHRLLHQSP